MKHESIKEPDTTFRPGRPGDVEPLLRQYGFDHFYEGGFNDFAEFDLERAVVEMTKQVARDDTPLVVAAVDGEDVGWISWTMMHTFTKNPIGVLWTIYVAPEHRKSLIGRKLVWSAIRLSKAEGACAFFATVAPTSLGGQALCRIFESFGFSPMGGAFFKGL
jgi:L-amino acid N-acyltransferase YncA